MQSHLPQDPDADPLVRNFGRPLIHESIDQAEAQSCWLNATFAALLGTRYGRTLFSKNSPPHNALVDASRDDVATLSFGGELPDSYDADEVKFPDNALKRVSADLGFSLELQHDAAEAMEQMLLPDAGLDAKVADAFAVTVETSLVCTCGFTSLINQKEAGINVDPDVSLSEGLVAIDNAELVDRLCDACGSRSSTRRDRLIDTGSLLYLRRRLEPVGSDEYRKRSIPIKIEHELSIAGRTYGLQAIVGHVGETVTEGHYLASVTAPGGVWLYDDDETTEFTSSEEAFEFWSADPYVFLYEATSNSELGAIESAVHDSDSRSSPNDSPTIARTRVSAPSTALAFERESRSEAEMPEGDDDEEQDDDDDDDDDEEDDDDDEEDDDDDEEDDDDDEEEEVDRNGGGPVIVFSRVTSNTDVPPTAVVEIIAEEAVERVVKLGLANRETEVVASTRFGSATEAPARWAWHATVPHANQPLVAANKVAIGHCSHVILQGLTAITTDVAELQVFLDSLEPETPFSVIATDNKVSTHPVSDMVTCISEFLARFLSRPELRSSRCDTSSSALNTLSVYITFMDQLNGLEYAPDSPGDLVRRLCVEDISRKVKGGVDVVRNLMAAEDKRASDTRRRERGSSHLVDIIQKCTESNPDWSSVIGGRKQRTLANIAVGAAKNLRAKLPRSSKTFLPKITLDTTCHWEEEEGRECGVQLASAATLAKHIADCHEAERQTCQHCDATFANPLTLSNHSKNSGCFRKRVATGELVLPATVPRSSTTFAPVKPGRRPKAKAPRVIHAVRGPNLPPSSTAAPPSSTAAPPSSTAAPPSSTAAPLSTSTAPPSSTAAPLSTSTAPTPSTTTAPTPSTTTVLPPSFTTALPAPPSSRTAVSAPLSSNPALPAPPSSTTAVTAPSKSSKSKTALPAPPSSKAALLALPSFKTSKSKTALLALPSSKSSKTKTALPAPSKSKTALPAPSKSSTANTALPASSTSAAPPPARFSVPTRSAVLAANAPVVVPPPGPNGKITCANCNKPFKDAKTYRAHPCIYGRKEKRYLCPVEGCTGDYASAWMLKMHTHCPVVGCGIGFSGSALLQTHIERDHNGKPPSTSTSQAPGPARNLYCTVLGCKKYFKKHETLSAHLKKVHPAQPATTTASSSTTTTAAPPRPKASRPVPIPLPLPKPQSPSSNEDSGISTLVPPAPASAIPLATAQSKTAPADVIVTLAIPVPPMQADGRIPCATCEATFADAFCYRGHPCIVGPSVQNVICPYDGCTASFTKKHHLSIHVSQKHSTNAPTAAEIKADRKDKDEQYRKRKRDADDAASVADTGLQVLRRDGHYQCSWPPCSKTKTGADWHIWTDNELLCQKCYKALMHTKGAMIAGKVYTAPPPPPAVPRFFARAQKKKKQ
ncbi:hypothetical protein JCM3766R1_001559 [Sporobolomyces carnicolor]